MKIASVAQFKAQPGALLEQSAKGPVVVTRRGKPVAVLVGVTDPSELDSVLAGYRPRLRDILDAANARIEAGQGIPHDEFWRRVEAQKPARPRKKARKKSA
jgi:prevent-host-death family protein